jgi:hypothetical protein
VSQEWDVLAQYVADLAQRAPKSMQKQTDEFRREFVAVDSAQRAAADLFEGLFTAGALNSAAAPIWEDRKARYTRQFRDLLSAAANLDMRIRQASVRKKTSTLNHDLDRAVALEACLEKMINPQANMRDLIMEAAKKRGEVTGVSEDTYYKRISRIVENPRERIGPAALIALKRATGRH